MPHNLITEKLTEFIEQIFNRDDRLYLACNEKRTFSLLNNPKHIICGHIRKFVTLSNTFGQYKLYLKDLLSYQPRATVTQYFV